MWQLTDADGSFSIVCDCAYTQQYHRNHFRSFGLPRHSHSGSRWIWSRRTRRRSFSTRNSYPAVQRFKNGRMCPEISPETTSGGRTFDPLNAHGRKRVFRKARFRRVVTLCFKNMRPRWIGYGRLWKFRFHTRTSPIGSNANFL